MLCFNPSLSYPAEFEFNQIMHFEKCFSHVKVLKLFVLFGAFSTIIVLMIYSLPNGETNPPTRVNQVLLSSWPIKSPDVVQPKDSIKQIPKINENGALKKRTEHHRGHMLRDKIKRLNGLKNGDPALVNNTHKLPMHSVRNLHIFYEIPVNWYHPNESRYQDSSMIESKHLAYQQPNIVFYPMLGQYQPDNKTLQHHFKNIKTLGSTVLILTWSPIFQKFLLNQLFDEVKKFNLQIAIEIDDYPNRTGYSLLNDIEYFHREFWQHDSLYKVYVTSKNMYLPWFYIKNVGTLPVSDWSAIFSPNGIISIRGSPQDAIFIGHIRCQSNAFKIINFTIFQI